MENGSACALLSNMKLETAKKLVEIGEEGGLKCSLRASYSGRGMFGRETAGVVTESIPDLLYLAGLEGVEIDDYSSDNMGLDYIIY